MKNLAARVGAIFTFAAAFFVFSVALGMVTETELSGEAADGNVGLGAETFYPQYSALKEALKARDKLSWIEVFLKSGPAADKDLSDLRRRTESP